MNAARPSLLLLVVAAALSLPGTRGHAEDVAAPKSERELAHLYSAYFKEKNIDGILSLYDLKGVKPDMIALIKQAHSYHFGKTLKEVTFGPLREVDQVGFYPGYAYWKNDDKGNPVARMVPTVAPSVQVNVVFPASEWRAQIDGATESAGFPHETRVTPRFYTMAGKKDNRYYLVAFRPQEVASAPASPQEIADLYVAYFREKNIGKILSLYDFTGVEPDVVERTRSLTQSHFARKIAAVSFLPPDSREGDYSYESDDHKARILPTVAPVKQMLVKFAMETMSDNEPAGMEPMWTLVGKKNEGYYLVSFKRRELK